MKLKNLFRVKNKRRLLFSPNLYYGEGIDPEKTEKLKKRLLSWPLFTKVFLLTLPENDSDQIDVLNSKYLAQGYYGDHALQVIGIAGDHEDAVSLILKITEDCLAIRKDCMLKEFLKWQ